MIPVDPMNRLLAALEGARTPGRKMRVLVRAWRALRRMSPDQRKLLAAEVGSDGAEELLEQLSDRHSGLKPALLLQALERIRGADPAELVQLAEQFRRPDGRKRLVNRGLEAARQAIAGDDPPATQPDAGPRSAPPAADRDGKRVPAEAVPVAAAVAAIPISKPAPPASPTPVVQPAPVVTAPPPPIPAAAPRPNPNPVPAPPVEVASPPRPGPPVPAPAPKVDERSSPVEEPARLIEDLGRTESLVRRLARLRAALQALHEWPVDRLAELIEQFPEGWPRRRALSAILEAGIPRDRHRAVYLIEKLESPISRRWCVRTLLLRSGWSEGERRALLDRHDLPRASGVRAAARVAAPE